MGKDVAVALGYGTGKSLANAVARHVAVEDKGVTEMMTPGGKQKTTIINESGLYSLILGSKLEKAKNNDKQRKQNRSNYYTRAGDRRIFILHYQIHYSTADPDL